MVSRKIAAAATVMAVIALATVVSAPAQAGVGGCLRGCGGGGGWQANERPILKATTTYSILDSLRWVLPADLVTTLKSYRSARSGGASTEGVGGCFFLCKF